MSVEVKRSGPRRCNVATSVLPPALRELADVLDFATAGRMVRPGQRIVTEGRQCDAMFLIAEGVAAQYRIPRSGQRQILNFLVPGDFAGNISCRFKTALFSVECLTDVTVVALTRTELAGLFDTVPRLAAELFWSFGSDAAILAEHLVGVGRRPALERVAHFLLELFTRMREVGLADERTIRLPLTRQIIGDALGLNTRYVNQLFQQLREQGLVRVDDQLITIEDMEELAALADFRGLYLKPLSIGDMAAA